MGVNAKKKNKFSIKMQKKLLVLFAAVLLAFGGLSARLFLLTRDKEAVYQKKVLAQQQYDSVILPYRRGDIVDARGTKLATSEKVYNLVIDAKVMNTELRGTNPYLEPTLAALGRFFDLDMAVVRDYVLTNKTSAWYVPLKQLKYEEISDFLAAREEDANIQGVWFEEEYKRLYPYGALAADAIGFSGADNQGSYGLEEFYNETLNGINGREYGYLNDDLALERTVKAAVDGNSVHSTIDANVQLIVEKYLKKFMDEYRDGFHPGNGAENVGCIIQWVDSGEILAMASSPGYDLNDVRSPQALLGSMMVEQVDIGNGYYEVKKNGKVIDQETLDAMSEEELYLNLNNLWKNYCITGTYEPGSVAKTLTMAAALEKGSIAPNNTFECGGKLEIGGYEIKCHSSIRGTHTLELALATSCNVSLMKIAQSLGVEDFCEYQSIFNLGLKTNIDLAGEARTASLIYSPDKMGPTDLATNSFGQNFNASMIQMITAFSSLINGGYYYEPHMVNKITNAAGATVKTIEPRILKQTISESTSAYLRQYCLSVVETGTGKTARPAGYRIGGKTGTAETIDQNTHKRSETDHVVSFLGYAPADDPKIAIYVVVDRPNVELQGNARLATTLVRNIFTEVLPYLNIFMTEELTESEKQELAALNLEITTQYARRPESGAAGSEEGGTGEGGETGETGGEGGTPESQAPWMSYPVDPESGYRVDPATGNRYDAQTGALVVGDETTAGGDIPVSPGIG